MKKTTPTPPLAVSLAEAARLLSLGETKVRELVKTGVLTNVGPNLHTADIRIAYDELVALVRTGSFSRGPIDEAA